MGAARTVRVDLGAVDRETAQELLVSYDTVVQREAFRLRLVPAPGVDREDLVAVGQIAVLEAHLSWNRHRNCTFVAWVKRIVQWRMRELVQMCANQEEELKADLAETNTPESRFIACEEESWFEAAVSRLTPRQGAIIAARLEGETMEQIASTLGIHYSRVSRDLQTAVTKLRRWVEREAVDCHIRPR